VYGNNTANVLQTASVDEIFINQSNNDTVTNNITTAPDLTPPTISSLTESPSSGDLNAGKTVTFTLNLNEAVTVAGGTPTLTLNDGGVATYAGGSDSNALTFSHTVGAGQNTASLAATAVNLNSATVTDGAGNAADLSLSGLTQTGPQIDTTPAPTPNIISDKVIGNRVVLSGTEAESSTTISIYDGTSVLGTTSTGPKGTWIYTTAPLTNGAHVFTTTATDAAGNVSAPSNPYDQNIGTGPTITAAPIQIGTQFYIYNSAGSGVALSYAGTSVTVGGFAPWTPIAATQTASGYDIAWQNASTGQYTVWTTDSNGNYTGNLIGAVSGSSYALESLESTFNQDLNGDGVTGLDPLVIQTDTSALGSTSLAEIGGNYFLFAAGGATGPELQYYGTAVTSGMFGSFNPIGAVQTAGGYEVAWTLPGNNLFTLWSTDSNGNYISNIIGAVPGSSTAFEQAETTFGQDLNGDGVVGLYAATGTTLQLSQALSEASGAATIAANATLELAASDSASVTFAASTGTLKLDQPSNTSTPKAAISSWSFCRPMHPNSIPSNTCGRIGSSMRCPTSVQRTLLSSAHSLAPSSSERSAANFSSPPSGNRPISHSDVTMFIKDQ
jgi:large repetitive protein